MKARPPVAERTEGDDLIARLGLAPHPEGGWFRRTWSAPAADGVRPAGSAIYYLLLQGERSAPHRIDATEIWHHYAGASVELVLLGDGEAPRAEGADDPGSRFHLGPDVLGGEEPQVVVPAGVWQAATTTGGFSLVGCTVVPAFVDRGFEMVDQEVVPG